MFIMEITSQNTNIEIFSFSQIKVRNQKKNFKYVKLY